MSVRDRLRPPSRTPMVMQFVLQIEASGSPGLALLYVLAARLDTRRSSVASP